MTFETYYFICQLFTVVGLILLGISGGGYLSYSDYYKKNEDIMNLFAVYNLILFGISSFFAIAGYIINGPEVSGNIFFCTTGTVTAVVIVITGICYLADVLNKVHEKNKKRRRRG